MIKPVLYWTEPSMRARAEVAGGLRRSWQARGFLLGWIPVLAVLVWALATGAYLQAALPLRLLMAVGLVYVLFGVLLSLSLFVPLGQVRLEPQRVAAFYARTWEFFPMADVAAYRVTDCGRWRELALRLRDSSEKTFGVPLRVDAAVIRQYFDERGVARAEDDALD